MSATLRKSSLSPPGGFHTQVSAQYVPVTCNRVEQTLSTQIYSARLTHQEERKDSKDMQGYLACGFIAYAGSITKRASLYSIFISGRISSLITILCKHMCYFQAGDKQSDFLLPSFIFQFLLWC